jgi:hypothetical protein
MRKALVVLTLACAWPMTAQTGVTITAATVRGGATIGAGLGAPAPASGLQEWQFGLHVNKDAHDAAVMAALTPKYFRFWDAAQVVGSSEYLSHWAGMCNGAAAHTTVGDLVANCNWAPLTSRLDNMKAHGIRRFEYTVFKTPNWAGSAINRPPTNWGDLDNFVNALHQKIGSWEAANGYGFETIAIGCGNEPNAVPSFWFSWTTTSGIPEMVTYCQHVYGTVKSWGEARYVVLTPALQGCYGFGDGSHTGLDQYLAAGGNLYADNLAYHAYCLSGMSGGKPVTSKYFDQSNSYKAVAAKYARADGKKFSELPIYNTEAGFENRSMCDMAQREAYMAQFQLIQFGQGIASNTWYATDNWDGTAGADSGTGTMWFDSTLSCAPNGYTGSTVSYPSGLRNDAGAKAWLQTRTWMLGKTAGGCAYTTAGSQHIGRCDFTDANGKPYAAVWDQNDAGGSYAASGFSSYQDLDGVTHAISGSVAISKRPVWMY